MIANRVSNLMCIGLWIFLFLFFFVFESYDYAFFGGIDFLGFGFTGMVCLVFNQGLFLGFFISISIFYFLNYFCLIFLKYREIFLGSGIQ